MTSTARTGTEFKQDTSLTQITSSFTKDLQLVTQGPRAKIQHTDCEFFLLFFADTNDSDSSNHNDKKRRRKTTNKGNRTTEYFHGIY